VSAFLRIKYLILAAFLTMSFVNNGIVIRNYKHVSWIIAAPCRDGNAAESKGVRMHEQNVREISCHLLKRASLHWNIGNELYYNIYINVRKTLSEQKINLLDRDLYRLFEMFSKREVITRIITCLFNRSKMLLLCHSNCSMGIRSDRSYHSDCCADYSLDIHRSSILNVEKT
jgi:hypothetical protein